jgi:hypothetical protein
MSEMFNYEHGTLKGVSAVGKAAIADLMGDPEKYFGIAVMSNGQIARLMLSSSLLCKLERKGLQVRFVTLYNPFQWQGTEASWQGYVASGEKALLIYRQTEWNGVKYSLGGAKKLIAFIL